MPTNVFPLPTYNPITATAGPLAAARYAGKQLIIPGVGAVSYSDPRARAHIESQGINWNDFISQSTAPVAATGTGGTANVPGPTAGVGPYGMVPGTTTNVDPAALWRTFYPNLAADTAAASNVVRSQLAGQLTPEVQRAVTDAAVARGVAAGVGGSPFAGSVVARDLGLTAMDLQNRGVSNLNQQLGTFYQNLVGPTTQLAQENAVLASAPNPAAAAAEQQRIYEQQQQRSFERQQALMNQQFAQQMAYLNKYLTPQATGGSSRLKPYGTTYTMYEAGGRLASAPYQSNIIYR